jgi:uncharacterized protein YbaA (DUF1428 family)
MKKTFNYVDGFVLPVPRKNLDAYKKMAKLAAKVWLEHGAIDYVECVADDVKSGKTTSFPQSVKLKKGEVVVFSWVTYKSRSHRDRVLKKVMSDPRLMESMSSETMPFDGMRMFWGGFKPILKY